MDYKAEDWHWIVGGDETKAWSSAARAYVPVPDHGHITHILSEQELGDVLVSAGCADRAPSYVPQTIPMWQARAALHTAGVFDMADRIIKESGDFALQSAWEYATELNRNSPSVVALGSALGLGPTQLDDLFLSAATIRV